MFTRLNVTLILLATAATACDSSKAGQPGTDETLPDATPPRTDPTPVTAGEIPLTLHADAAATGAVVSVGVPFAPGQVFDDGLVRVLDGDAEVPAQTTVLARWPKDDSIRSVLVAFRGSLAAGATAEYVVEYGATRTASVTGLAANPDGPIVAMLPDSWYAASRVLGYLSPRRLNSDDELSGDTNFAEFDAQAEQQLGGMSPSYESYGATCASSGRSYYDSSLAMLRRFARNPGVDTYRRAREETTWYRDNEVVFNGDRSLAWHTCQGASFNPSTTALTWMVLRRTYVESMVADYLLTGDPAAREAAIGLGEGMVRNYAQQTGGENALMQTERNMGWYLAGVTAHWALTGDKASLDAMNDVVDMAVSWQAAGTSGAFEHDINRPDPSECETGPAGASPFMTAILIDGLVDYDLVKPDERIPEVVRKAAVWYETQAITSDGLAFRYLWGCESDPYDDSSTQDLNGLIAHVFGAAYTLTGDAHWIEFGRTMAEHAVDAIYVKRPKQWNQWYLGFSPWLGHYHQFKAR